MLFYAAVDNTIEQTQSIFIEMYTSPVATKIAGICLVLAAIFATTHKFIKWCYEKDIPKLLIGTSVFAGISLTLSVGGLLANLNVTAPLVYGWSAGAIAVLTIYSIGYLLFKNTD